MDRLTEKASRLMFPLMLVFGIHVAFHGHITPGGGFPAGAMVATAYALLLITSRRVVLRHRLLHLLKWTMGASMLALVLFGHVIKDELAMGKALTGFLGGGFTPVFNLIGFVVVSTAIITAIYMLSEESS